MVSNILSPIAHIRKLFVPQKLTDPDKWENARLMWMIYDTERRAYRKYQRYPLEGGTVGVAT